MLDFKAIKYSGKKSDLKKAEKILSRPIISWTKSKNEHYLVEITNDDELLLKICGFLK